jgi:hypothetical protein
MRAPFTYPEDTTKLHIVASSEGTNTCFVTQHFSGILQSKPNELHEELNSI